MLDDDRFAELLEIRARRPEAVAAAARRRARRPLLGERGRLFLVAADHPARGALAVGGQPMAMADRRGLLGRLLTALAHPGVDGVLGTADVVEDLLLLGALDGKVAIGSMNRGGLAGASFELDDRFTAYTVAGLLAARLDGGKMLLRIADDDPGSLATLTACAAAIDGLAAGGLVAMVEPFAASRENGRVRVDLRPEPMTRALAIASGLAATSAYTWLKVPVVDDMARVMSATTLPCLLLGGDLDEDRERTLKAWAAALGLPNVRGLVVGRTLLYPPDGDVAGAVDAAASLLTAPARAAR
jgi:hypothetical protein